MCLLLTYHLGLPCRLEALSFCLQTSTHFGLSVEECQHRLCAFKSLDRWNSQPIVHKMGVPTPHGPELLRGVVSNAIMVASLKIEEMPLLAL